jgi:hypothetical protein
MCDAKEYQKTNGGIFVCFPTLLLDTTPFGVSSQRDILLPSYQNVTLQAVPISKYFETKVYKKLYFEARIIMYIFYF